MNARDAKEQIAREDIHAYADAIEYFETHDLGDELETMPEVHFDVSVSPCRRFPLCTESGQHERQ